MEIGKIFKNFHEIIIDPHKDRPEISKKGAWALSIISAIPLGIPHIISAIALRKSTKINATQLKIKSIFNRNIDSKVKSYRNSPYFPKLSEAKKPSELAKEIIEDIQEFSVLVGINNLTEDMIPDLLGMISDKLSNINCNLSDILKDPEAKNLLTADEHTKKIVESHEKLDGLKSTLIREVIETKSPEENLKAVTDLLADKKIALEEFINTPIILNQLFESRPFQGVIYLYIQQKNEKNTDRKKINPQGIPKTQLNILNERFLKFKAYELFEANKVIDRLPQKSPQVVLSIIHTIIKPLRASDLLENPSILKELQSNENLYLMVQILAKLQPKTKAKSQGKEKDKVDQAALKTALIMAKEHAKIGIGLATQLKFDGNLANFHGFYKEQAVKLHPDKQDEKISPEQQKINEELFKKLVQLKKIINDGVHDQYREAYLKLKGVSGVEAPQVSVKSEVDLPPMDKDLFVDPDLLD